MSGQRLSPIEMIETLIGFDTTSRNSNLALIDWVGRYLSDWGIESRRTYDADRRKANLFATIGPNDGGGVVLSGHTDVVPVDGQAWDSDPFTMMEKDGRLYGRGTADMKSFLAIALAHVPDFLEHDLKRPLHLALSYDEEVGCIGVSGLIDDLVANLPHPAAVIVGEPTDMQIVNAHKGVQGFETRITGQPAHSSQPHRGANAIVAAGRLIAFIHELAQEKRGEGDPENGFEPPYTTFGVGTIQGGTALNIVAGECHFLWEFRSLPGEDIEAIIQRFEAHARDVVLPGLQEFSKQASITTHRRAMVPALAPETEGAAETLLRHLTGANQSSVVSFGTEGGLFQEAGLSTVVCGPGSIDQAHQPNEFIECSQVTACSDFLLKIADWASDPLKSH